jgi:hypothetical protein
MPQTLILTDFVVKAEVLFYSCTVTCPYFHFGPRIRPAQNEHRLLEAQGLRICCIVRSIIKLELKARQFDGRE